MAAMRPDDPPCQQLDTPLTRIPLPCHWLTVTIPAEWERIWIGDQEVAIARDHFRNGRHVRIKFSAPLAAAAAAYCTLRGRTFVCRACDARYDYSSRHTARYTPALNRL